MSEPCQKEAVLTKLEVKQAEIQGQVNKISGDTDYLKKRIDNGLCMKIDATHDTITQLQPVIAHHAKIVNQIEMMGWWLSRSVLAVVIGVVFWAVSRGYVPKI